MLDDVEATPNEDAQAKKRAVESMLFVMQDFESHGMLFSERSVRPCLACNGVCRIWDIPGDAMSRATVALAGMTCKDVSNMNRCKLGKHGPSGRPLLTFLHEIRFRKPSVVLGECTQHMDVQLVRKILHDLYDIVNFSFSPADLGWWADRTRMFCILVLKAGPYRMNPDCWDGFKPAFCKERPRASSCKRGDMFYAAPHEHVVAELASRCKDMGMAGASWHDTLSPAQAVRKLCAQRIVLSRSGGIAESELASLSMRDFSSLYARLAADTHVSADLNQNPSHMLTVSGAIPCLLSKFSMYSLSLDRPLLPEEAMLVQGIDVLGVSQFQPPWGKAFSKLAGPAKNDLCGNAINVHCAVCVVAWTLAHLVPRDPRASAPKEDGSTGQLEQRVMEEDLENPKMKRPRRLKLATSRA